MLRTALVRLAPKRVPSLAIRVGYATVGAMIVMPKSISFADHQHLQPTSVVVTPPVVRTLQKWKDKSILQKLETVVSKIMQYLRNLYRICTYTAYAAPAVLVLAPAAYYLGSEQNPQYEKYLWDYIIWAVEGLGPTFIKLAQWASTRPDLFPPELTSRLERLQDGVEVKYPFEYVENTLDEAFGPEWRTRMTVERDPIGSGCVAQVFKGNTLVPTTSTPFQAPKKTNRLTIMDAAPTAKSDPAENAKVPSASGAAGNRPPRASLKNSGSSKITSSVSSSSSTTVAQSGDVLPAGTKVAVKLIHPHVERLVRQDVELLTEIGNLLDQFKTLEIISLGDMVREFAENMYKQLDLRIEANNLKKFNRNFAEDDAWACFPLPIDGLSNKSALVETLLEGKPVAEYMKMTGEETDKKLKTLKLKLSDLGTRTLVKMIFFDNFIHGDLHPGNILIMFNKKGEPMMGFLDCGIVYSTHSEEEHDNLMQICRNFIAHDGYKAGTYIIKSAKNYSANLPDDDYRKKRHVKEEHEFCNAMQQIVNDSEKQSYFEHMGEYIDRICATAYKHSVKLHAEHFHVFMALKVAEGISLSFNRKLDIISTALPMITKAEAMRKMGITKFPLPDVQEVK